LIYYATGADSTGTVWNTVMTNADHVAVLTDTIKYHADNVTLTVSYPDISY